jgi:iron complex outermembrane receptor protein
VTWWQNKSDTVAGQGIGFTPATNPVSGTSNSRLFNAPGLADLSGEQFPDQGERRPTGRPMAGRSADIGTRARASPATLAENNRFWGLKAAHRTRKSVTPMKLVSPDQLQRLPAQRALSDWSGAPYRGPAAE